MSSLSRGVASAAVAAIASQFASAGFIYDSASRGVSATVAGVGNDTDSTSAYASWYGAASMLGGSYTVLSTQGSELAYSEMTFVGAAQISSSGASEISATSGATVTFLSNANETIAWIMGLGENATGANSSSATSILVTDLDTGAIRLASSGDSTGSGSFGVVAGHHYRVQLSAASATAGAGEVLSNYNVGFFSIPAPGAAALLTLAACMTRARRR